VSCLRVVLVCCGLVSCGNSLSRRRYIESVTARRRGELVAVMVETVRTLRDVWVSINRLLRGSITRWLRKSMPMIGCVTAATMNFQVNCRHTPKLRSMARKPKVVMVEPFAACSWNSVAAGR
jgi:hypothetical protein